MDHRLGFVLDRFNAMPADDGARLEVDPAAAGDDRLLLRYLGGPAGDCERCVLAPSDLETLIGEALGGVPVTVTRSSAVDGA